APAQRFHGSTSGRNIWSLCERHCLLSRNGYKPSCRNRRTRMADETFEMFVQRERARLHGEREAIFTQQHELEGKLAEINKELSAIDAYEAAKSGKLVKSG